MHDGPVRMLAKGVLHGIVPWARARAFFAAHLRRRLAEEELLRHIASADPGLGRAAAREALKNWFLSSPLPAAPAVGSPQRGSGVVLPPASRRGEELWRNDGQFLEWVEGGSGAARVAMELKALRLQASARTVHQLCRTPEGTEGLVRGLAQCLAANPSLQLQLRSLLK
ncbi:hypothetical protein H632_c563p3 [Helicosporidium sp. ATCC 50920]|nr:hypothetical protein H632_c563p3 [Helicosporidium sp. ATCC 50920]|eukprot:KDD75664.1 hypothetical protein H632_c563p3 [Helicosporidium sp. ATCC 50920]